MNRFRLVLAFVFMSAASLSLAAFVVLQLGAGPAPEELVLWTVLRDDGLVLAAVLVLLGLGWAYFAKIFASDAVETAK
jgi:hypothetical protein